MAGPVAVQLTDAHRWSHRRLEGAIRLEQVSSGVGTGGSLRPDKGNDEQTTTTNECGHDARPGAMEETTTGDRLLHPDDRASG